jgi:hypothetical protein
MLFIVAAIMLAQGSGFEPALDGSPKPVRKQGIQCPSGVRPTMRANLKTSLRRLIDDSAFVHHDGRRFFLTKLGMKEVEKKKLHGLE